MTSNEKMPADVVQAILANRKIEAIKLLRERNNLGLKEAKQAVDAYIRENQHLIPEHVTSGSGIGGLVLIVAIVAIAIAVYKQYS